MLKITPPVFTPLPTAFCRLGAALCLFAALVSGVVFSTPVHAEQSAAWELERPLAAFSARYIVGNDLVDAGQADIALAPTNEPDSWRYSLATRPIGIFKLTGKGRVQESTTFKIDEKDGAKFLQPQHYTYRQDDKESRSVDATFNWAQGKVYYERGGNQATAVLQVDTLDRLSMTLAMMSTLTPQFESLTLSVFDSGRMKQLQLINDGFESIDTSLGRLDTVRVRTVNVAGSSRETLTWFAPSLGNLPVRIEQLKRGDLVARLSISDYQPAP